jgi:hypothetical protein
MSFEIDLALNKTPKGRPNYFIGIENTLRPKIIAKPSTFITLQTETNSTLAKLILKPETASKHKKVNANCKDDMDLPH